MTIVKGMPARFVLLAALLAGCEDGCKGGGLPDCREAPRAALLAANGEALGEAAVFLDDAHLVIELAPAEGVELFGPAELVVETALVRRDYLVPGLSAAFERADFGAAGTDEAVSVTASVETSRGGGEARFVVSAEQGDGRGGSGPGRENCR